MMARSYQQNLPRARVNITLDVETGGASQKKELPLKLLLLGNYSNAKHKVPLLERPRHTLTAHTLDAVIDELAPSCTVDIQHTQVRPALHDLANAGTLFDLIFLDPPYTIDLAELAEILRLAVGRLTKQGLAILEHRAKQQQPDLGGSIVVIDSRRYGNTGLSFFGRLNQ